MRRGRKLIMMSARITWDRESAKMVKLALKDSDAVISRMHADGAEKFMSPPILDIDYVRAMCLAEPRKELWN